MALPFISSLLMMAALLYDNWGVCILPDNFTSLETCSDVIVTDNLDLS